MKKMSVSLVVLLALCVFLPASAQVNLGVLGGLNLANINADPKSEGVENSNLTAFGFGGVLNYSLNKSIALRLEPMYLLKGANQDWEWGASILKNERKTAYLEIPMMVMYTFGTKVIKPYAIVGPSIGLLLSAKNKYNLDGHSGEEDIKNELKSFDFSFGFGAGVSVPMNNNFIFLEARYALGLTYINDDPTEAEIKLKNKCIQIFAGITFPLGK